jgi:uncharacterized protein with FMN-binding domain
MCAKNLGNLKMDKSNVNKRKKIQSAVAVLALGVLIVGGAVFSTSKSPKAPQTSTAQVVASTSTSSSTPSSYKNGTYNATGTYYSPGGEQSLKVQLTISNNTVVASSVTPGANDPTSTSYESLFIGGYKSQVVGKKINTIKVTGASGSSLTAQGFTNALKQIEQQAKA